MVRAQIRKEVGTTSPDLRPLGYRYLGTYRALFMLANSEPRSDIIRAVLGRYTIVGKRKGERAWSFMDVASCPGVRLMVYSNVTQLPALFSLGAPSDLAT